MLRVLKGSANLNFARYFNVFSFISLAYIIVCIYFIVTSMTYGVDFRGGAEIQLKFGQEVSVEMLREKLNELDLGSIAIQQIGLPEERGFLLKIPVDNEDLNTATKNLEDQIVKAFPDVVVEQVEIVGPKAGSALKVSATKALAWALIAIMIYVGLRFNFSFAPGAAIALLHDVLAVAGCYAIFNIEFDLQTVAALMAIVGYSVNDTVVIYDRVRENQKKFPAKPLVELMNMSLNDTLSRTILTSLTTLFASGSLLLFGGKAIQNFFIAMTAGIVLGTYSTIFISSSITLAMDKLLNKKG